MQNNSRYPGAFDSFQPSADPNVAHLQDAVSNLQTELGLSPKGNYITVSAEVGNKLDKAGDNLRGDITANPGVKVDGVDISAHTHSGAAGDAPNIPISSVTGLQGSLEALAKPSVRLATTTGLPSFVFDANALTASANGALTIDGAAVVVDDRVLVKNETSGDQKYNGIYTVTATGDVSNPWSLCRAADMDVSSEVQGSVIYVREGAANPGTMWGNTNVGAFTLNTTGVTFTQLAGPPQSAVSMNSQNLTNVADPGNAQDAATRNYVDTRTLSGFGAPVADVSMGSHKLTNVSDPSAAQDAATRNYVDTNPAWKPSVRLATSSALPAYSFNADVLTASSNGALTVDAASVSVDDRVLVRSESSSNQKYNGIYVVTQVGDAGTPWILTRAADMNTSSQVHGAAVFVRQGGTGLSGSFASYIFVVTGVTSSFVLNTTGMIWSDPIALHPSNSWAVRLATTAALPAYTSPSYNVLTASANGALSVDGSAVAVSDRLLIKNETAGNEKYNGVYRVSATGDASTPWSLVRGSDMNSNSKVEGTATYVREGTYAGTLWSNTNIGAFTLNTTAATFAQLAGPPQSALSMNSQIVTNVADPVSAQDAATRNYVDTAIGIGMPTGAVIPYAGSSSPAGWHLCDGSSLLRAGTYAALFAVIGATYGSADADHFNVPDLRGRTPVCAGQGSGLTNRALGLFYGAESTALAATDIPAHSHPITGPSGAESSHTHSLSSNSTLGGSAHTHTISGSTGAGTAHSHGALSGGSFYQSGGGTNADDPAGTHANFFTQANTASESAHTHPEGTLANGNESAHTHDLTGNTAAGSSHTHTLPVNTDASAAASTNPSVMPPVLALNYIIKT